MPTELLGVSAGEDLLEHLVVLESVIVQELGLLFCQLYLPWRSRCCTLPVVYYAVGGSVGEIH